MHDGYNIMFSFPPTQPTCTVPSIWSSPLSTSEYNVYFILYVCLPTFAFVSKQACFPCCLNLPYVLVYIHYTSDSAPSIVDVNCFALGICLSYLPPPSSPNYLDELFPHGLCLASTSSISLFISLPHGCCILSLPLPLVHVLLPRFHHLSLPLHLDSWTSSLSSHF